MLTPRDSMPFWLTLIAAMSLTGTHVVYWTFTHPVNKVWLKDERLGGVSSGFFSLGKTGAQLERMDWTELRDRWEYSHVARAVFAMVSFIALVTAVSL